MIKKLKGMTLLEVMLVLVIGVSFILLGIRQYQQYKVEESFIDVKRNVDILFQALGQYYQGNCRTLSDASVTFPSGQPVNSLPAGALAPTATGYTASTVSIDISSVLLSYLPSSWPTYAIIIDTSEGDQGYQASLILSLTTKNAYACWNSTPLSDTGVGCTDAVSVQSQTVAFWLAQVSAKIRNDTDGSKTLASLGPTGASCASSVADHCDRSTTPTYLIWQALPTKSGFKTNSDLWLSQTQEAAFNQQYTHDVMYEMANPHYTQGTSPLIDTYYLCGN